MALAATGVANLASIMAALRRAGTEPFLASSPQELVAADFAVLPGVGSFGSAMTALKAAGMDEAFKHRVARGLPTLGVCAGMQLFFEGSEESPGVAGMGILPGFFRRFPADLPVPQLGWNRVVPREPRTGGLLREGWAYFANSYRLSENPKGFSQRFSQRFSEGFSQGFPEGLSTAWSEYGEAFVAAIEGGEGSTLLLCQFHPELSGPWGLELLGSWLARAPQGGAS